MKQHTQKIILITSTLVFAVATIILASALYRQHSRTDKKITRDLGKEFVYTSPILDCEETRQSKDTAINYQDLSSETERLAKQNGLSSFSVYYRDLNNGPWVGINEKNTFAPASLMKTPLLIAFLKHVERKPELLDFEVVASQEYFDLALKQNFDLTTKIEKGQAYTLRQVAEIMIQDSDNVATIILSKYIIEKDFNDLLHAIGLTIENKGQDVDIRVKDFAGFFRVLYNASYLDREMSELALSILAGSTFKDGIVAGINPNISVAHKYGERSIEEKQTSGVVVKERQFHDCGIVYHPSSPYILCIMTKGKDFSKETHFIQDVSSFIYKKIK